MVLALIRLLYTISFIFSIGQNPPSQFNLKDWEFIKEKMISDRHDFVEINLQDMTWNL